MISRYGAITITVMALLFLVACGAPASTEAPPATATADTPVPPSPTPSPPTATPLALPDTPIPPTATPPTEPTPTATAIPEPEALGDTWRKTYGGSQAAVAGAVLLAGDGGFYIVGTTNLRFEPEMQGDVYLIRTDAAGEVLWERTYGGDGYDGGQGITWAEDGNLLIAGVTTAGGAGGMDAYLLKVDPDGNELWSRTHGGPLDEYVGGIEGTPDRGYILGGNIVDPDDVIADPGAAGYGGFEGRSNLYLLKVDAEGDEIWSRHYKSQDNVLASGGVQTPDGGFLALATITHYPDPDDDILLIKLDGEGNEVWSRTWEEGITYPYGLIATSDGNYLITASYRPLGGGEEGKSDFLFLKVDPGGEEIWRSVFGDPDLIDYGHVLAEAPDGGYVAVAERTPDRYTWEADLALVKIDGDGQPLWQQTWPAAHTMLAGILPLPDGGYLIAGSIYTDPVFNILLIRTGGSAGGEGGQPASEQGQTPVDEILAGPQGLPVDDVIAGLQGLSIDQFMEESYRQLQLRDPDTLIYNDHAGDYGVVLTGQFTDRSDAYIRETQQLEAAVLDLLRRYDRSALSAEQELSYDIYEWYLDDLVRGQEFVYDNYLVNAMGNWDMLYWLVEFMSGYPIASEQDAEDYVARLSQLDTWLAQLLEGLELREQAGVVPPRFVVQRSLNQLETFLPVGVDGAFDPEASALYTSFRERLNQVEGLSADGKQALLDAARIEIEATFLPAFSELQDYMVHLASVASDDLGVGKFPDGEAYYAYILRHHTSTDLSPDEVHELGLAEVARIQAEMRAAAAQMGHPEDMSMAALDDLLTAEGEYLEGQALRAEYERLIASADQAAVASFDLYPSEAPVVLYDPSAPPAYYQGPPLDGSGPGRMIVNLQNPARYTLYNVPVLVHHETIPGHHVQLALGVQLDPPNFRRDHIFDVYRQHLPFQAYVEGWALYSEQLAYEMGLYEGDPLGNLGRLRLQLHRTARMVVDTGIHARGWTLEEATGYMEQATGTPYSREQLAQIITIPGQACGYNVGRWKILELRQRAMDQLGDQFDIKRFHNVILQHGAMPLVVLERVVDDWILSQSS